jgi:hypothetical protein
MVYAHKVCRVTFSGKMWGGQEEWSTGLFLGQRDGDSAAPTEQAAADCAAAFKTMFTHGNMKISNSYTFDKVKLASIDANGHTIDSEVVYGAPIGGATGAATNNFHPSQCSLAVTLRSDRPRGKAARGRMFLPGTAVTIEGSGRIPTTDRNNMSGILKTFFDSFINDADLPGQLILASKGTGPLPALTAQNDYVHAIELGDVVDTQRRRRNGLSEQYTRTALLA